MIWILLGCAHLAATPAAPTTDTPMPAPYIPKDPDAINALLDRWAD